MDFQIFNKKSNMNYRIIGDRIHFVYDDLTEMDFYLDELENKINDIPVAYMSSDERAVLQKYITELKEADVI